MMEVAGLFAGLVVGLFGLVVIVVQNFVEVVLEVGAY